MRTFKISVTDKKSGETQEVHADFEDEEVMLLEDFLTNIHRLLESKLIQEGAFGNLRLKFNKDTGFTFEVNLPEEDHILALLHRLRRFILNDERSSYNRVTGIIGRRFEDVAIRSMLKAQRGVYDGKEFQTGIQIESNGVLINSDKMLFDWLNAFEFHNDETKRKEIELLHRMMPLDASRAVFLMLLAEKVKAILNIGNFVALLLGKIETLETRGARS